MRQLSNNLVTSVALLKQPVKQEIIHHHHAHKIIWLTAALFLIVSLVSAGLFITANNLSIYKANDTKYRYLKLQSNKSLNKLLAFIDSLYLKDTSMRDSVIAKEEQNQREFQMMQRAIEMEKEAKNLRQQVNANKSSK